MTNGVIDSHVHVGLSKYRPVEDFREAMDREAIGAAVLVQHLGETDNRYIADCVQDGAGRFVGIAIASSRASADKALASGLAGLRLPPGGLVGDDHPSAVWSVLNEHRGIASVTGPFDAVVSAEFLRVVEANPDVTFRLEHLGWLRYGEETESQWAGLLRLGRLPNVVVMWSGFFANSRSPYPFADATRYLEESLTAFGPDRIVWSGDWNRPGLAEHDYRDAVAHIRELSFLAPEVADLVLAGNAARVFGLKIPETVQPEG